MRLHGFHVAQPGQQIFPVGAGGGGGQRFQIARFPPRQDVAADQRQRAAQQCVDGAFANHRHRHRARRHEVEHQHHEERVENGAGHVVQLHQAVAHDAGAQQHGEQDLGAVGQVEQQQRANAADQSTAQPPAIALPRQREAGLHDDDDGQHDPVVVRGKFRRQPAAGQRHGNGGGRRHAQRITEVRRIQPQVAGQQPKAEFLARDKARQRLVDAQHVGGLGVR
ncbi:hypothetical protein D3C87_1425970 [compost metagenome]